MYCVYGIFITFCVHVRTITYALLRTRARVADRNEYHRINMLDSFLTAERPLVLIDVFEQRFLLASNVFEL